MRNISFSHTIDQFINGSKRITRRKGWKNLKPGDILNACEKCQGLKKGEKIKRLGKIIIISARREPLNWIADWETHMEGFPLMSGDEFITFFCKQMGGEPDQIITRIHFEHLSLM